MRLDAGVDDHRAAASPVLLFDECMHAKNIRRRIAARKRDSQKIAKRRPAERCVIDKYNHGETRKGGRSDVLQRVA